jgi:urease accessory protein
MIHIYKIIGNIHSDSDLKNKYQEMIKTGLVEKIEINRLESDRARIRKMSDKGTDLALTLIPGYHINNGDVVMLTEEKMVIANRTPENVAMISLKGIMSEDQLFETATKIGHTIGNMHRPFKIVGGKIYFPIQSQSEVGLFQTLLSNLINNIVIKSENIIFEPEAGYDVHEH